MIHVLKESLWNQFGASIDMVKNAIVLYPEANWNTQKKFFYNAYHCLLFLDYYLTLPPENFSSRLPFTLAESTEGLGEVIGDVVLDRVYSKSEMLDYLQASRAKGQQLIASLTAEKLEERWMEEPDNPEAINYALLEIILYNMRHVQHHAAQLNMLLRQEINQTPGWIAQVENNGSST